MNRLFSLNFELNGFYSFVNKFKFFWKSGLFLGLTSWFDLICDLPITDTRLISAIPQVIASREKRETPESRGVLVGGGEDNVSLDEARAADAGTGRLLDDDGRTASYVTRQNEVEGVASQWTSALRRCTTTTFTTHQRTPTDRFYPDTIRYDTVD